MEQTYTKEQLINAMEKYNKEYASNPDLYLNYEEALLANPKEAAMDQVEKLISFM